MGLFPVLSFASSSMEGEKFELQFNTNRDCDNDTYCATLQIKAEADPFLIGTSSIFVTYNASALGFSSYESLRFDGTDLCIFSAATAWEPHAFDGNSIPGSFNLTLEIPSGQFSCPSIESDWIDIGMLCFNVTDDAQTGNLNFDIDNTNFNRNDPNDGTMAIGKGTLSGTDESLSCAAACPAAGTACDDGNASTENDVEDGDCGCAGTACPTTGTACDDGNASTENDIADGNCGCAGTACPTAGTACDDGNASTENDIADGNCGCAGTACPTAGTACDDGNASTENDIADGNCGCAGTACPIAGTACDDENASTENDMADGNCGCAGTACPTAGTACDDENASTENDMADGNCGCTGTACPTAGTACDDGNASTENDIADGNCGCAGTLPSCPEAGTVCDDGNASTENDREDGSCNCVGTACPTAGTACDDGNASTENDIADGNCGCAGTACPTAGTACDDENASTENDVADGNCGCAGTACPTAGTACDDGNASTENDIADGNCGCAGTLPSCPAAGTACDDGNVSTENDMEDGSCNCVGTACPAAGTACDDGNPDTENDIADGNCGCTGMVPSCPAAGTACDDGNVSTENDMEDGSCNCVGTACPTTGTACDDGNASTENDIADGNCGCAGTIPSCPAAGTACDDGNAETEDDKEDGNCNCAGIAVGCPAAGTPCSDNDLTTINDRHDGACNCIGDAALTTQQIIDLRLKPILDCNTNSYCVTIQSKAQGSGFTIGTSSILLNYAQEAMQFASYTSIQFDEEETCIGGTSSPWDPQVHNATSSGIFNLILNLNGTTSCPEITNANWEDIGTICFDILDPTVSPDLAFDLDNTQFNAAATNDGSNALELGLLNNISDPEALSCQQATNGTGSLAATSLSLKVLLQGPLDESTGLMNDGLRSLQYLPLQEPYTSLPNFVHAGNGGGELINTSVLVDNGNNSIVDWVFVELHSAVSPTSVIATKSALLQRDGDVVDIDGVSPIIFTDMIGSYYVAIKHRNHLGAMSATPLEFIDGTVSFDFTDPNMTTFGDHAQRLATGTNVNTLWGGNANQDAYLILVGGGLSLPDRDHIFFELFLTLWAANPNGDISYNSVLDGYFNSDTNMDGQVKFQGPSNDIDALIFFNILNHPSNTNFLLNYIVTEQIP